MSGADQRPVLARISVALGRYDANVLLTVVTCTLATLFLLGVLVFGVF